MKEDSLASKDSLLEEHGKLKEQFDLFGVITDELAEMEHAHIAGQWVDEELEENKEVLLQLQRLLSDLLKGLSIHWGHEAKDLLPFLKETGQSEFVAIIKFEHGKIAQGLKQFLRRAGELAQGEMGAQQFSAEVSNLRHELKDFFEMMEEHAIKEEKIVFQLGHGV